MRRLIGAVDNANRRGRRFRGPIGDHTACAAMTDLRVCARLAFPQTDRTFWMTWEARYRYYLGVKRLTGRTVKIEFAGCHWS
jgi:hypothetical protein